MEDVMAMHKNDIEALEGAIVSLEQFQDECLSGLPASDLIAREIEAVRNAISLLRSTQDVERRHIPHDVADILVSALRDSMERGGWGDATDGMNALYQKALDWIASAPVNTKSDDVERRIVEAMIAELESMAERLSNGELRWGARVLQERIAELRASLADSSLEQAADRVIARLKAMSPTELRQTFIDSGIIDENGKLTEPYRSASLERKDGGV
jgi:hypothetical protein